MINYSIIVPHRDTFELLKRAIASIPDRTDIEIIIIDNSHRKYYFDDLQKFDNSKCFIYHSNIDKGAGHARNVGLNHAKGKWLLFLDADDFFNSTAFLHFDRYLNTEFDIIYFSTNSIYSDTLEKANRHLKYNNFIKCFINKEKKSEDNLRYWYVSPWGKLIRSRLLSEHTIKFEEIPASNDLLFSVKIGHYAKSITANSFPAYCITITHGSLTRTISRENERSRFYAYIRQYQFMTSINKKDMRFQLMAEIIKSFRFGFDEFLWYIKTSYKERINIFLGIDRWPKTLYRYFFMDKDKNDYSVIIKNRKPQINS